MFINLDQNTINNVNKIYDNYIEFVVKTKLNLSFSSFFQIETGKIIDNPELSTLLDTVIELITAEYLKDQKLTSMEDYMRTVDYVRTVDNVAKIIKEGFDPNSCDIIIFKENKNE
jgi:hypothetical protein